MVAKFLLLVELALRVIVTARLFRTRFPTVLLSRTLPA